jgi:hypothetical protein
LQAVPSDGLAFVSIRVADLWRHEAAQALREKLTKDFPQGLRDWQKAIGLPPEQVERLTLVFAEVSDHPPTPVAVVYTREPFDKAQVLETLVPSAKEEMRKGHKLYVGDKGNAVHFLGTRAFLVGDADPVRLFFDHHAPVKKEGPLSHALQRAAEHHALVAGFNPQPITRQLDEKLPEQAEPYKPLLKTQSATVIVDVGKVVRAQAQLHFAGEDEAKAGAQAVKKGLAQGQTVFAQGIKQLAKEPGVDAVVALLNEVNEALGAAQVEQHGSNVHVGTTLVVNLSEVSGALASGVAKVREAADRQRSQHNLKQLALAMHNYNDTYRHLPAHAIYSKADSKAGKPLLSWRVQVLPFLNEEKLYKQFHLDEPWDSEHNKKLLAQMPDVFRMPSQPKDATDTHYQGFVGKGAFFEGENGLRLPADFPDGTSNTIMLVEAAKPVPWTAPEDLPFDVDKPLPKLGSHPGAGFNAALVDGSVRHFQKVSEQTLKAAITRNGGEVLGPDF